MPNLSGMEHSSGKRLVEQQGTWNWELSGFLAMEMQQAPGSCINHRKSLWLWYCGDEPYSDAKRQIRKTCELLKFFLYSSGNMWALSGSWGFQAETGAGKKTILSKLPSLSDQGLCYTHTLIDPSCRPRRCHPCGVRLPGGCTAQSTKRFRTQQAGLTRFLAVPSCPGSHNPHVI